MGRIRGKTAVVGVGEVPTGMYPERSFIDAAVSASEMAIRDAGIRKEDIDTVIPIVVVSNALDNANMICSWMVEELGLGRTAKSNFQIASGGSSSANALKTAAALVHAGLSRAVLVVHSDRLGTGLDLGMAITMFAKVSTSQEYEMPYGFSQLALAGQPTSDADFAFHMAVAEAANNPRFAEFLRLTGTALIPRSAVGGSDPATPPDYARRLIEEHEAILTEIQNGHEDAARAAMRAHLRNSQARYRLYLRGTRV